MSRTRRILLVEDDSAVVELVCQVLEEEGFQVSTASDGATGLRCVVSTRPDLLILDLLLPRLSGVDLCWAVRQDENLKYLPIMILTGRDSEADRVMGLEIGADDYMTKPFSPKELVARVKALLRRAGRTHEPEETVTVGALVIDSNLCQATRDGKALALTPLEFRLLHFLAAHPNKVFSRAELLAMVWGTERNVTPRSVDTYFWRLRDKLGPNDNSGGLLQSVRGRGYLLRIPSVTEVEQEQKPYVVKSHKRS